MSRKSSAKTEGPLSIGLWVEGEGGFRGLGV